MNEIKVLIVDDHDMVRMGLKTYLMLEEDIVVWGEAKGGSQAVDMLRLVEPETYPDVILMDLMMDGMDGVEATRTIMQMNPKARIIILTSFLEDDKVVDAVEAGAITYVMKTVSSDELISVVRRAAGGEQTMGAEVSQALSRGIRQRLTQHNEEEFTPREKEVLLLIAEGKSNKDISEELHISIKTVKTHVSNLLMKCGLEDRTQLAVYAHRKGWVQ
ncbi:response regulator [Marinicrinis lubricantis]|uniref:Response regulator n=1 Tax=Marinicrinis lubricantis TaxID=2086470 RepID=A0ABW1ILR5_9BACL